MRTYKRFWGKMNINRILKIPLLILIAPVRVPLMKFLFAILPDEYDPPTWKNYFAYVFKGKPGSEPINPPK